MVKKMILAASVICLMAITSMTPFAFSWEVATILGDVDTTPPSTPVVTDEGVYTFNTTGLYASWTSTDPESGIAEYQYKITQDSTTGTVIRDWTSTGTCSWVIAALLSLQNGKTYYFGVRAKNGVGLWSEVGYSNGITVDTSLLFDTGESPSPYPSIAGNFEGYFTPTTERFPAMVTKIETYPCSGTAGRITEWHFQDNITWLEPGRTYKLYITLASYPQYFHQQKVETDQGTIEFISFIDVNGTKQTNWIPTLRIYGFVDTTPPTTPVVTDSGAYTKSTTTLSASWTSSDLESGIVEYQYCIGTSKGATDVVGWTSTGTSTLVTKTGLSLQNGKTYYFSVKAKNGVGLWSAIGYSDGITVDTSGPSITNRTQNPQKVGQTIVFKTLVTDSLSGVKTAYISVNNGPPRPMSYSSTTGLWEFKYGPVTIPMRIPYYFVAWDKVENYTKTGTFYLYVVR